MRVREQPDAVDGPAVLTRLVLKYSSCSWILNLELRASLPLKSESLKVLASNHPGPRSSSGLGDPNIPVGPCGVVKSRLLPVDTSGRLQLIMLPVILVPLPYGFRR